MSLFNNNKLKLDLTHNKEGTYVNYSALTPTAGMLFTSDTMLLHII